jgi:hypothetical protein
MSGYQEYKCRTCGYEWESLDAPDCPRCRELAASNGSGNFVARHKYLGLWEWRIIGGPAIAGDGTRKWYVWAEPVKRILYGRKPVKNKKRPPLSVFILPLPSSPNSD